MKKRTYLRSVPNLLFSAIYLVLFIFSFLSVMVTCDEYEGGNYLAEFGTLLFDFYGFPIFTVLENTDYSFSSGYNWLFLVLFILNIGINYLAASFLVNRLLKVLNRFFLKKSH